VDSNRIGTGSRYGSDGIGPWWRVLERGLYEVYFFSCHQIAQSRQARPRDNTKMSGRYLSIIPDDARRYDNKGAGDTDVVDDIEVEPHFCSLLSCFLGTLCLPWSIFSCFVVDPKEAVVLLDYGKFNGIIKEPGCHYVCCIGRTILKTSTKVMSIKLPSSKTIDRDGNPLIVSGILSYQVRNAKRAILDVENVSTFVSTQSVAALKQIVARYPYEGGEVNLKTNADSIALELVNRLQARVKIAGIAILTFTFNEISYATEIASAMLKKQQAQAMLSARSAIVRGAVDIANGAVRELIQSGIAMDDADKAQLASQLLTVLCSENSSNVA